MHDPFYCAIVRSAKDEAERTAILSNYFTIPLSSKDPETLCVVEGSNGAAIWKKPALFEGTTHVKEAFQKNLYATLGNDGAATYTAISKAMYERVPATLSRAWYLSILAVKPEAQGRGMAARLLQPTLASADQQNRLCYLETFNSKSLPFYRRMGFNHATECYEPLLGRTYWIMWREPQAY
ncbi:GNAT family N-acetyltransferase [Pseudovibrio exalbescens]|uniref:GNAT family N-acetyltransferase n=1 Tax=Pseudovibrio exalbescens TaxID=197461 RepID=UPI002366D808|nr:GNAT family N-acetyltransferase [Pseudovibrio exalbescens]MDD7908328.1 GNAT family N-acetyltransferase [Pseudovibrio exalbescens]